MSLSEMKQLGLIGDSLTIKVDGTELLVMRDPPHLIKSARNFLRPIAYYFLLLE